MEVIIILLYFAPAELDFLRRHCILDNATKPGLSRNSGSPGIGPLNQLFFTLDQNYYVLPFTFQISNIRSESVEPSGLPMGLETPTPARRRVQGSNPATKLRDSRVDSGSVDLETPLELSPKSPLEVLDEALTSVMRNPSPVAPPRVRPTVTNSRYLF